MKSIRNNNESIIIINKSKFICNLIKVTSELDAIEKINNIKTKYKDATHNCYAYIINNKMKFSDDKEPNGTAGMPILNVLKNKKLDNILCVVTRYFGGIKLGAGGLVRAYTNSVTNCLKDDNICEYIKGIETIIEFDISKIKIIDNVIKDIEIQDKTYENTVKYIIGVPEDQFELLYAKLESNCIKIEKVRLIWIEKKLL